MVVSYLSSLTHDGEACNASTYTDGSNTTHVHADDHDDHADMANTFASGVILSVIADAFIAIAVCIQKYAHNKNQGPDGNPVKHFIFLPVWWAGMILNIGGEVGNMVSERGRERAAPHTRAYACGIRGMQQPCP
jgi:heme/copper-type cytochrome/quinol oxidase subunit 2